METSPVYTWASKMFFGCGTIELYFDLTFKFHILFNFKFQFIDIIFCQGLRKCKNVFEKEKLYTNNLGFRFYSTLIDVLMNRVRMKYDIC